MIDVDKIREQVRSEAMHNPMHNPESVRNYFFVAKDAGFDPTFQKFSKSIQRNLISLWYVHNQPTEMEVEIKYFGQSPATRRFTMKVLWASRLIPKITPYWRFRSRLMKLSIDNKGALKNK